MVSYITIGNISSKYYYNRISHIHYITSQKNKIM